MRCLGILGFLFPALGLAQTPFSNLDFEAATFRQPSSDWEYSSNAMPGWKAYIGSREEPVVLRNYTTLDSPGVTVVQPGNWGPRNVRTISGNYSVGFYSGVGARGPNNASIAQIGDIPANAKILLFKVYPVFGYPSVSLGGDQVQPQYLTTRPGYSMFAVDVSAVAGQTLELRFTAPLFGTGPYQYTGYTVDDLQFSTQTVTEARNSPFSGYFSILPVALRDNQLAWRNPLCSSNPLYNVIFSEVAGGPWRHFALVTNAHTLNLPSAGNSRFYQVIWVDEAPRHFDYYYWDRSDSIGLGRLNLNLPGSPYSGSWTYQGDGNPTPHPEGTGQLQARFVGDQLELRFTPSAPNPFFFRGSVTQTNTPEGCTWTKYEGDAFYIANGITNHAGIFSATRVP